MAGSNPVLIAKEVDTLYVDDFVRPHRCAPLTKPLFNIVRWQFGVTAASGAVQRFS